MKKIKIILDIIMLISMIALMKTNITGLQLHEILGICLFIIFIIHKIVNFKWIKSVGKNIFSKNMKRKPKIMFFLNMILFIFVTLNVITGIVISKFVLVSITVNDIGLFTMFHKFLAWWSLILIARHIGLHWENVVNCFERKYKGLKENKVLQIFFILLYIIVAIMGIWSLSRSSVYSKLILDVHNEPQNSIEIKKHDSPQQNDDSINNKAEENGYNINATETPKYRERKFKNNKNHEKQQSNDSINNEAEKNGYNANTTEIPTLEEYLSQFTCDGCKKQCSLLNTKCEIGEKEREEKTQEYYKKYGENGNQGDLKDDNQLNRVQNEENNKKHKNKTTIINVISIMWMFIGGTYYINKVIGLKKK